MSMVHNASIKEAASAARGWRDGGTQRLHERLAEIGLEPGTVQTMFEYIELDEGHRKVGDASPQL